MNAKLREALENSNGLLEELALIGEWGGGVNLQEGKLQKIMPHLPNLSVTVMYIHQSPR